MQTGDHVSRDELRLRVEVDDRDEGEEHEQAMAAFHGDSGSTGFWIEGRVPSTTSTPLQYDATRLATMRNAPPR
jgi:hypothetical protein